jgi:hypothetical protein
MMDKREQIELEQIERAAAENSHSDASLSVFKYRAIKVTAGLPHLCTRFICSALINNLISNWFFRENLIHNGQIVTGATKIRFSTEIFFVLNL